MAMHASAPCLRCSYEFHAHTRRRAMCYISSAIVAFRPRKYHAGLCLLRDGKRLGAGSDPPASLGLIANGAVFIKLPCSGGGSKSVAVIAAGLCYTRPLDPTQLVVGQAVFPVCRTLALSFRPRFALWQFERPLSTISCSPLADADDCARVARRVPLILSCLKFATDAQNPGEEFCAPSKFATKTRADALAGKPIGL